MNVNVNHSSCLPIRISLIVKHLFLCLFFFLFDICSLPTRLTGIHSAQETKSYPHPETRCAHENIYFDMLPEEVQGAFCRNSFCDQCLSCSGRTVKKNALKEKKKSQKLSTELSNSRNS